ncbi:hypothetical protein BDV98DRAFT_584400 [Pterulicium gracile]|uniref:Uncharacterized protein n=1 Tax=Pterulicium gracile TaxID=1884261 RepID=A0A5C3QD62_9AGAR|nr:hypothetical protein BDV98DRAFT_584400 [Pterula gracilis]
MRIEFLDVWVPVKVAAGTEALVGRSVKDDRAARLCLDDGLLDLVVYIRGEMKNALPPAIEATNSRVSSYLRHGPAKRGHNRLALSAPRHSPRFGSKVSHPLEHPTLTCRAIPRETYGLTVHTVLAVSDGPDLLFMCLWTQCIAMKKEAVVFSRPGTVCPKVGSQRLHISRVTGAVTFNASTQSIVPHRKWTKQR